MALASVTRLRLRGARHVPRFLLLSFQSARQARRAPGFLGGRLLRDEHGAYWTLTMWRDETAMRAFRDADAHAAAMRRIGELCDEAATATVAWTGVLPTWAEAADLLRSRGRGAPLRHGSPAHRTGTWPATRAGPGAGFPLRPRR